MPIRLKDIARDLGVSTVTVSKVLRGNSDIGDKTRERVLKRMRELNYQPNMLARGLASGRTFTVGLVVPDLVHPFFGEFAKSLSAVLRENQRALILASSEEDPGIEQSEIRTLLSRGIDALLIASCQTRLKSFYEVGDERTPFLLVDRNFPYLAAHFVGSDDYAAGVMATEHLLACGRRRIAHIGGAAVSPARERLRGYRDTLARAGIGLRDDFIIALDRVEETGDAAGYQAMRQLLQLPEPPDAVFCYNDLSAIGAMEAAHGAGLAVAGQVAFVGCGNLRYANYLRTPLSSIDHRTEDLGRAAGALALELAADPSQEPRSVILPPRLVVRESSVPGSGEGAQIAVALPETAGV